MEQTSCLWLQVGLRHWFALCDEGVEPPSSELGVGVTPFLIRGYYDIGAPARHAQRSPDDGARNQTRDESTYLELRHSEELSVVSKAIVGLSKNL